MHTIQVSYTYTPALVARIFVATGKSPTYKTFELKSEQLTPAAREAALTALVASDSHYDHPAPISSGDLAEFNAEKLKIVASWDKIGIKPKPVDAEPDEAQAITDSQAALVAAARYAPTVLAQRDAIRARLAAERAVKLETAIVAYLAEPLSVWLEKRNDEYLVDSHKGRPDPLPHFLADLRKLDPRLEARTVEAQVEAERLNAEQKTTAAANVVAERQLLTDHGSPNQLERYDADKLPTEEFDALAKSVLFAPLADFPRYEKLTESDCPHDDGCDGSAKFRSAEYEGPLTAEQWDAVKKMSLARPTGSECDVREHSVYCSEDNGTCNAGVVDRLGFRVTIEWAGNKYSQEYAI